MGEDGIYFTGKEKYNIRNEWVPKINSGYYNIGKEERFYNPEAADVNISDIYPCIMPNVAYVNGPYLTMAHLGSGIINKINNNVSEKEYVMYKKEF